MISVAKARRQRRFDARGDEEESDKEREHESKKTSYSTGYPRLPMESLHRPKRQDDSRWYSLRRIQKHRNTEQEVSSRPREFRIRVLVHLLADEDQVSP